MPSHPSDANLRSGGNWLVGEAYYGLTNSSTRFFRLQVQPVYKVDWEQADFKRFLETGERPIDRDKPELQGIRDDRAKGVIRHRVYVITPPLTDYQRWVFPSYHLQAEAGQDLRVLDTTITENPGLPDFDFIYLEDKDTVIKLHYEPEDGTYIGRELLPDADLNEFRRYRDLALEHSMPFLEYEELLAKK